MTDHQPIQPAPSTTSSAFSTVQPQLSMQEAHKQQIEDAMKNPAAFVAPAPPQQPQPPMISFNTTGPEPTQPNAYQSIIEQQSEQIAALMAQNQALNAQVTQMVQNGAQFNQYRQPQQVQQHVKPQVGQNWDVQPQQFPPVYAGGDGFAPMSLAENVDVSLEGLASEIGKKPENA